MARGAMGKRAASLLLALCLALCLMGGCGAPAGEAAEGFRIVCTVFPPWDWLRALTAGVPDVELTLLTDTGVEMHSYQPTVEDVAAIAGCDLFVYVGGSSDEWAAELAAEFSGESTFFSLTEALGDRLLEEETGEGMEPEAGHAGHGAEAAELDEHVWLSLKNAAMLTEALGDTLAGLLPAYAGTIYDNCGDYCRALEELDGAYAAAVAAGRYDTLVFGDRFPFRYLTEDYHLNYYAAFPGCSADTDASFETVVFLAERVDALGLPAVLAVEGGDGAVARAVVRCVEGPAPEVLTLDAMQSVSREKIDAGYTYLSAMAGNLEILKCALGAEGEM